MNCPLACKETSFEVSILETKNTAKTCIADVELIEAGYIKCYPNKSSRQATTLLQYSLTLSFSAFWILHNYRRERAVPVRLIAC